MIEKLAKATIAWEDVDLTTAEEIEDFFIYFHGQVRYTDITKDDKFLPIAHLDNALSMLFHVLMRKPDVVLECVKDSCPDAETWQACQNTLKGLADAFCEAKETHVIVTKTEAANARKS